MAIMYLLESGRYTTARLSAVEVERVTDSSVWIAGRRHSRSSWSGTYYTTKEEAHAAAVAEAELQVVAERNSLQRAQDRLGHAKGLLKNFEREKAVLK